MGHFIWYEAVMAESEDEDFMPPSEEDEDDPAWATPSDSEVEDDDEDDEEDGMGEVVPQPNTPTHQTQPSQPAPTNIISFPAEEVWNAFEIMLRQQIHSVMTLSVDPQSVLRHSDILVGPIIPSFARMICDAEGKFSYDANQLMHGFSANFVVKQVSGGYYMRILSLSGEYLPSQWVLSTTMSYSSHPPSQ